MILLSKVEACESRRSMTLGKLREYVVEMMMMMIYTLTLAK